MKTKNYFKRLFGGVMVGLLFAALGCSDGELPPVSEPIPAVSTPVAPTIKSFTADPQVVDFGSSATLSWEVEGADKVDIAASTTKTNFSYSTTKDFKASTVVENLQETTTFVLTATKMPAQPSLSPGEEGGEPPASGMILKDENPTGGTESPQPAVEPAVSMLSVTVTVRAAANLSIGQFYAEAPLAPDGVSYLVDAGAKTILHWEVAPEEAQVSLTSSTGEQPVLVDCTSQGTQGTQETQVAPGTTQVTTTEDLEQQGEVPTTYPASGCASVQPTEDSTYTLKATVGDQSVTKDLSVKVTKSPIVDYFTANGSASLQVPQFPADVELSWKVRPATAKLTITADPADSSIQGLPQDSTQTEGKVTVTVSQNTTFTLTAKVEGQPDATATVQVTSTTVVADCSQLVVNAPTAPVFEGESVKVNWTIPQGMSAIVSVRLGSTTVDATQGSAQVSAAPGGVSVDFLNQGGQTICSKALNIPVASLDKISSDKAVRVIQDVSDPDGAYVGLDLNGFNGGKIRVVNYQPAEKAMDIDFFTPMKAFDSLSGTLNGSVMEKTIQTFPVNAIAKFSDTLFVATTGVVLYKKAEGDWKALTTLLRADDRGNYPGSHPSCFGKTQTGKQSEIRGEIVTLGQVCDMVTTADGKLYVGTDRGLYYLDDVEGFIANGNPGWQGRKPPLYAKVINDIEVSGSAIYAAGSMGVSKSTDGGATWESQLDGVTAYSVAQAQTAAGDSFLVAGVEGGLKARSADGTWQDISLCVNSVCATKVYSVAVDPYDASVIYAGADSGFYVSRDGGQTFADATPVEEDGSRPVVRSVTAVYSGDPAQGSVKYYLYLATESGVMRAYLSKVSKNQVVTVVPPASTPPSTRTATINPNALRGVIQAIGSVVPSGSVIP